MALSTRVQRVWYYQPWVSSKENSIISPGNKAKRAYQLIVDQRVAQQYRIVTLAMFLRESGSLSTHFEQAHRYHTAFARATASGTRNDIVVSLLQRLERLQFAYSIRSSECVPLRP
jgi:hypothetical protein